MKNKLLTFFLTLGFFQCYWSQNSGLIFAPKFQNLTNGIQNLPTYGQINTNYYEGYKGQAAKSAQNIITDSQGDIVFFIVDQFIYDKNGKLIDVFTETSEGVMEVSGIISEIAVVPAPEDCNTFYLLSTRNATDISYAKGFYAKLVVKYNAQGQLLEGSGLEQIVQGECENKGVFFENLIGSAYYANNNNHDEGPRFAVVNKGNSNDKYLFIQNGLRTFRCTITNTGIQYDNVYVDLISNGLFSNLSSINEPLTERTEMEVIMKPDSNYRIAFSMIYTKSINNPCKGVFIYDVDNNGSFISGSAQIAEYQNTNQSLGFQIKGIEFSQDGNLLYVTHKPTSLHPGSLDVFDLTSGVPVKTIVETSNVFQYSQIEASFGNTMLIPHANGLAQITNANSSTPSLTMNFASFTYQTSTPFSNQNNSNDLLRLMQDQIDGMDYSFINPNVYEADTYIVSVNSTWTANGAGIGNPLIVGTGNIAYIKDELRIKAGVTLTIQNMEFRFSPGARVVIENGTSSLQGGRLIINNTIFTNEDRCEKDKLWLGVEVWGNKLQTQGTITNTRQGRFLMYNNSIVENARIGVLIGRRISTKVPIPFNYGDCNTNSTILYDEVVNPNIFDNLYDGGIVQATSSTLYNNQIGVYFRPYIPVNVINNLSFFSKTNFIWNGPLKENVSLGNLARLIQVNGISFKGCKFENQTPNLYPTYGLGFGIFAQESQFYVKPFCNSMGQNGICNSQVVSEFNELRFGIYTSNSNIFSFTCSETKFTNNQFGIYVRSTDNEKITQNVFKIKESNSNQSCGVALYYSTGYKVEENTFSEFDNPLVANTSGLSYGILVDNSGAVENNIYKNYFHHLKIGGQTQHVNSIAITGANNPDNSSTFTMAGLRWKCNDFQNDIYSHDMTLVEGSMNYYQGNATSSNSEYEAKNKAARNKFSLSHESFYLAHDILVSGTSQDILYAYLDAPRHKPDSYTPNIVDINDVLWNNAPIINDDNTCPSNLISKTWIEALGVIQELKTEIISKQELLDRGAASELITLINNGSDDEVKMGLLNASPYLSDEILLAYIASNPPTGHLKQIIIANSKLSSNVNVALSRLSIPNGIASQIAAKQFGISERSKLISDINTMKGEITAIYNDQIRNALLDESDNATFENLILILKEEQNYERLKLLLSTYLLNKDNEKIQETRELISAENPEIEFLELSEIQKNMNNSLSVCDALNENIELENQLINLKINGLNKKMQEKAACLLDMKSYLYEPLDFLSINSSRSHISTENTSSNTIETSRSVFVHIYPNPTTGLVNIDYPTMNDGELKIEVVDLIGKVAFSTIFTNTNGEQINLSDLHKGMYLVKITMDGALFENQYLKIQ
ncbi:MAG: T9SS type A sorting domain-containing protein [Flavobacteriia bacterium]|nr:T9SS type A sorting domain-containing protein [Flavobacteriia bacterium]